MHCCEMLGQRPKICIVAPIAGPRWALDYGSRACAIVTQKRELVEKLAYGMAKVLALAGT